jgi:hypothetical protein
MSMIKVLDLGSRGRAAKGYASYKRANSVFLHAVDAKKNTGSSIKDNIYIDRTTAMLPNYLFNLNEQEYDHIHLHMLDNKQVGHDGFVFFVKRINTLLKEGGLFFFSFDNLFFDEDSFIKRGKNRLIFDKVPNILRLEGFDILLLDLSTYSIHQSLLYHYVDSSWKDTLILDKSIYMIADDFSFYHDLSSNLGIFLDLFSDYLNFTLPSLFSSYGSDIITYSYEFRPNFIIAKKSSHQFT